MTAQTRNKLRLLAIPVAMRKTVIENGLTERFAQLLLRHPDDTEKQTLSAGAFHLTWKPGQDKTQYL